MSKKLSREQILRKERRLVRVPVDIEMLAKQIADPSNNYKLELVEGIPADSVFITAYNSLDSYSVFFVYGHELFEEVKEGTIVPTKDVIIKKVMLGNEDDY